MFDFYTMKPRTRWRAQQQDETAIKYSCKRERYEN